MRAAIIDKSGEVKITDVPKPTVGKNQVLVKINKVGVCMSDVHVAKGQFSYLQRAPGVNIGGHEGVGTIEEIGAGSEAHGLKKGERVAVKWISWACQECELCTSGYENICRKRIISGKDMDGCFSEYAVAHADYLVRIPDNISDADAAPVLCAGVTVYRGLKVASLKPGQWVAIIGAGGGLGHLAIQYAKAMGLKVAAIDGGAEKRQLCLDLGASVYVDFMNTQDLVKDVLDITAGGAHCALVVASSARAYTQATQYIRFAGCMVCIGLSTTPVQLPIGPEYFVGKGIRILGTSTGSLKDTQESLQFVANGSVKPHIVEDELTSLQRVLDRLEKGEQLGRVVLTV
uniref:ARAD1D27874p n=1 Tax=Blastobotrys adeninivorans TaxID=409370 RepID=A0A060TH34_BLAAD|nr:alcohol dehydrogenase 3 [Blastobotrys adeninivorans]